MGDELMDIPPPPTELADSTKVPEGGEAQSAPPEPPPV